MNTPAAPVPVLRLTEFDANNPFADDVFERQILADRLTGYIDRLKDGCVIAIDAPWGEGKTWFGQRWAAQLKGQGHKVAYIDAFKHDHVEDPFVMVCAEVLGVISDASKEDVKAKGIEVAKALVPSVTKAGINLLGRLALGSMDLSGDLSKAIAEAGTSISDKFEASFSKQFEEYAAAKESVDGFAKTLAEAAAAEEKPIVIFIDELDRCRPDFAVRTIERIKHFFDVPKVIFVLLLNRQQLEGAVCGVYGEKTDAATYLGKFVHLFLRLPKTVAFGSGNYNVRYGHDISEKMGLPQNSEIKYFARTFGDLATLMGLSFRHIERTYTLLALGETLWRQAIYFAWPIALKVGQPDLYAAIMRGDRDAHTKAADMIDRFKASSGDSSSLNVLSTYGDLHRAHASNNFQNLDQWNQLFADNELLGANERFVLLPMWFRRIDLDID